MIMPACMGLLTEMTGRCTRPCPGITGAGTAAPAAKAAEIIPTSGWRCVSCLHPVYVRVRTLPAPTCRRQWAVAKRTYEAAVELFAYLCKQYNLNPAADGVIISHREGHSRGLPPTTGTRSICGRGLAWAIPWTGSGRIVRRLWEGPGRRNRENGGWYRVRKSWADVKSRKGRSKCLPMLRSVRMRTRGIRYTTNLGRLL